jgi:serine/threonine protein kinase
VASSLQEQPIDTVADEGAHAGEAGGQPSSSSSLGRPPKGRFGRYELLGRLGRGGMADVYLALSTSPIGDVHKLVVIKRVREALWDDADFTRMFLDEARISARINHPNVVHTYAVEVDSGVPLIVMEYLDGVALSALAKCLARGSWTDRIPLVWALSQALVGLHHVHDFQDYDGKPLGLVHRDIKPGNIFVTFEGQVKVLDFGIAKATTAADDTLSNAIKGTARFMAPEMVGEPGRIDRRADVFSCGVVLWELATAKSLWEGMTPLQILRRLADHQIPDVAAIDAGIPRELTAICSRALQADPAARYASAAELRRDLDEFLRKQPAPPTVDALAAIVVENYREQRRQRAHAIQDRLANKNSAPSDVPIHESTPAIWTAGSGTEHGFVPRRSWSRYAWLGAAAAAAVALAYVVGTRDASTTAPPNENAAVIAPAEAPKPVAAPSPAERVETIVPATPEPTTPKRTKVRPRRSKPPAARDDKLKIERESPWKP